MMTDITTLWNLPSEIIVYLARFLSSMERIAFYTMCRYLYKVLQDHILTDRKLLWIIDSEMFDAAPKGLNVKSRIYFKYDSDKEKWYGDIVRNPTKYSKTDIEEIDQRLCGVWVDDTKMFDIFHMPNVRRMMYFCSDYMNMSRFRNLRKLTISSTKIDHLSPIPSLMELYITDTPITILTGFVNLESLVIRHDTQWLYRETMLTRLRKLRILEVPRLRKINVFNSAIHKIIFYNEYHFVNKIQAPHYIKVFAKHEDIRKELRERGILPPELHYCFFGTMFD
jgi:hypothetical protein